MLRPPAPTRPIWIGTFPEAGIGTTPGLGEGIWRTDLDLATGALSPAVQACRTPAPSFLVLDATRGLVHATAEADPDGAVCSFAIRGRRLVPVRRVASGGSSPTHLVSREDVLLVANYGDGTWGVLPLGADGLPVGDAIAHRHSGSGPVASRQEGSHAHSTTLTPDGTVALVCDLGTDELRRYRLPAPGTAAPGTPSSGWATPGDPPAPPDDEGDPAFRFRPGSGPRHAVFRAGGRLVDVVTELSAELVTLEWDGLRAREVARVAVRAGAGHAGAPGRDGDLPSHLALSADGTLLHVATRGPGTLTVFSVTGGADGRPALPTPVAEVDAGSSWPRHFAVVPGLGGVEFLLVAGELEGTVRVLRRGPGEVAPRPTGAVVQVPSAAFVLPG